MTGVRRPQLKQAQKAAELKGIIGRKGTSLASTLAILNHVAADDDKMTKDMLRDIARGPFQEVKRDLALPLAGGGEVVVPVADPSSLVAASIRAPETMQAIFATALQRHPGTPEAPWNLLVTWDEFNIVVLRNLRSMLILINTLIFRDLRFIINADIN